MLMSTFQLLKIVAPIVFFNLILGSLDVWTDGNLIWNLFTGAAECSISVNQQLCRQAGAAVFCTSSKYNNTIYDHSVCEWNCFGECEWNCFGDDTKDGTHYGECVKDPIAYCQAPDTTHNVVCGRSNHRVYGALLAGKCRIVKAKYTRNQKP